jgi:hypothetical protein
MGLREEAAADSKRGGAQTSTIMQIIEGEPDQADDVVALIWDDRHIDSSAVARTLSKHFGATYGEVSAQMVRHHRNQKPRP